MSDPDKLKILFVAAEVAPFAKVGGLADVAGALPKELHALGHDVRVIMPRYAPIDGQKFGIREAAGGAAFEVPGSDQPATLAEAMAGPVPVYFVECPHYFDRPGIYGFPDDIERFLYFCRAVLEATELLGWAPDVIHCNDWHTAVIPHWLHHRSDLPTTVRQAASILTIHNLAYQGDVDPTAFPQWLDASLMHRGPDGSVDLLSQGIHDADWITTVSERYAQEITTPEFGEGLEGLLTSRIHYLTGILNGIDYEVFNPATDPLIAQHYSVDDLAGKEACKLALQQEAGFDVGPRRPLIGLIGRLVDQKGFDLIAEVLEPLLAEVDLQVVILGTGEERYHEMLRQLSSRNRRQLAVYLTFDAALAQRIYAGSDMFLMPSRFEPCGLGQLISLRYGTVPVVRSTGGLADTVLDYQPSTGRGTGFVFRRYHSVSLVVALSRAFEVYREADRWREIQLQGMRQDVSWGASARRYVEVYQEAERVHRAQPAAAGS
ncbi:MAG: starch synthase [Chloroflexota bacterium]|nr:starch synthase [Chloroflexota bacterium]